jgi:hypothetical protein
MPEYGNNKSIASVWGLGEQMERAFDQVHKGVRIMPPMQQLIGIE